MRLFKLGILCAFAVIALPSFAAAAEPAVACVVPTDAGDPGAAIDGCGVRLALPGLSNAERATALKIRGRANHMAGNLDNAIRDFDTAIELSPNDPELRVRRGWTAYDKGDYLYVIALAEQAVGLDHEHAPAFDLLGAAAAQTGNLALAKAAYDKSIEMQPNVVLSRFHRYQLYLQVGAQREALSELDELLRLDFAELDTTFTELRGKRVSYRTLSRLDRATLLDAMGRHDDAERAFNDFVKVEPGPVSYGWRGWHFFDRSQFDRAQADLVVALSYDEKFWILHNLQGQVYNYTDRYDSAIASFTRSLELEPKSGSSLWGRALALRELHRTAEATKDSLAAIAADRDFLQRKLGSLTKLGYLQVARNERVDMPAVQDAVRACMLDMKCF
ncbi:MAG TPA: tetratricopeptide repeat protein [Rhizomicrobium sp.]